MAFIAIEQGVDLLHDGELLRIDAQQCPAWARRLPLLLSKAELATGALEK